MLRSSVVLAAPLILTSRKSMAQTASFPLPLLQQIVSSGGRIYNVFTTGSSDDQSAALTSAGYIMLQFSQTVASLQLDQTAVSLVPPTVSNNGITPFDANLGDTLYESLQALNMNGMSNPACQVYPDGQPRVPQVIVPHSTTDNYALMIRNFSAFLYYSSRQLGTLSQNGQRQQLRHVYASNAGSTNKDRTDVGIAAGAGLVGGGAALISASGVTYGTLGAVSVGAASLFTFGVAAIAAGVFVIGYFGYQYLSSGGSSGGRVAYLGDDAAVHYSVY